MMWCSRLYGGVTGLSKALTLVFLTSAPLAAEQVAVVAFGDSLTQGYGLIEQDGLVPQMRRWLEAQEVDVRLVNAGVSGDTTAGGLARIDWTLSDDIDAMIVTLGGNDMLRGFDPALSRQNLAGILAAAQAKDVDVLLVGMTAAGNYGPEYKQAFDEMYPELAKEYGALFSENFFAGLGSADPSEVANLMQPDGIHPNAKGVALIVEALGPDVLRLVEQTQN
ncbi:arylesterase [Shimia thalassica]|nr:arylesterase [Shimia thalassica]MDO6485881.1 arylesterase [Shimia thalassica]